MKSPDAQPSLRDLIAERGGAVMLEFLLAFPPLLLLFLGVMQLALLAVGDLVVKHAAIAGVRAAVVVLDDDPRHYGGEPRGRVDGSGRAEGIERRFTAQFAATPNAEHARADVPSRMAAIRTAVHAPLSALAPPPSLLVPGMDPPDLTRTLGGSAGRTAFALATFLPLATAIVFPVAAGADALQDTDVTADPLVLRVTHLLPCTVPIARRFLCRVLDWDAQHQRLAIASGSAAADRALRELQRAPLASQQGLLALYGVPVALLSAEASLPQQAAPYAYLSERGER